MPKPVSHDPCVDDVFGRAVLDLDDPEVGVAPALARDISIGVGLGDRIGAGRPHPDELAIGAARLRQHRAAGVAAVEFQQDRAGIAVAAGQ